ncbi:MAG: folate-binding protein YgfZ [Nitrosomonadales bacterium]|nr:folate-binding protein YgfZ [Nitrosomonadales bacterium]
MDQDWQDFLKARGARMEDGVVRDFGDAAAERLAAGEGTVLCDLSRFGLLRVGGEDAQSFLQNLLSNDIRETDNGRAQLSSFNNAKGRMLASMLIWREGADYLLQMPRAQCEFIRKKLSMYVLRSKVKIDEAGDERVMLGIAGKGAADLMRSLFPDLPGEPMQVEQAVNEAVLCREPGRYQVVTSASRAETLWAALATQATPVGSPCWDWLEIRAGIPFVQPETREAFVPQMLNFELIGGVNFKKGCYPGQEVVARMHYLGKAKRRMYLAHVDGESAPQAGDELSSAEMEGQSCGVVVNAAPAPQQGFDLLAVVQTSSHDAFPVHLAGLTGPRLRFQPLPYPLPQG